MMATEVRRAAVIPSSTGLGGGGSLVHSSCTCPQKFMFCCSLKRVREHRAVCRLSQVGSIPHLSA